MGGGQKQEQPMQKTSYELAPEQRQLLNYAMPGIAQFAAQTPERYQGTTVAGFTPTQQEAQASATGAAANQQQLADWSRNLAMGIPGTLTPFAGSSDITVSPEVWAAQQPTLQSAIGAATRPVYENLTTRVLPNVRGTGIAGSGLSTGTSRQGIAEGLAAKGAAQAASDVGARMSQDTLNQLLGLTQQRYATNVAGEGQRYGQNLSALYQALGLTPQLQAAQAAPATTLSAVRDVQQAMEQAKINEAVNAFNFDKYGNYLKSKDILSLVGGIPGGTNVSTANVPTANPWAQSLGGALSGASLGSALMPGIGTAAGAVGGAVLPFLFR